MTATLSKNDPGFDDLWDVTLDDGTIQQRCAREWDRGLPLTPDEEAIRDLVLNSKEELQNETK
jgi:hypothetical protein